MHEEKGKDINHWGKIAARVLQNLPKRSVAASVSSTNCNVSPRTYGSKPFVPLIFSCRCPSILRSVQHTHTDSHKIRHALTIPHEAVRATDEIGRQQRRPRSASASLGSVPSIHDQSVQTVMLNQSVPEGSVGPPAVGARARE